MRRANGLGQPSSDGARRLLRNPAEFAGQRGTATPPRERRWLGPSFEMVPRSQRSRAANDDRSHRRTTTSRPRASPSSHGGYRSPHVRRRLDLSRPVRRRKSLENRPSEGTSKNGFFQNADFGTSTSLRDFDFPRGFLCFMAAPHIAEAGSSVRGGATRVPKFAAELARTMKARSQVSTRSGGGGRQRS